MAAIEGGREAKALQEVFDAARAPGTLMLGEFGVGLNPRATLCGRMLEDEGAYGTIHFGIGANLALGGTNDAPIHIDAVVKKPAVRVDETVLIDCGDVKA